MDDPERGTELDPHHLQELKKRIADSPFNRWAGMELVRVGGGEADLADVLTRLAGAGRLAGMAVRRRFSSSAAFSSAARTVTSS